MHDEPLAAFLAEHHGPAHIAHVDLAVLVCHLVLDRRRPPSFIPGGMQIGIIVHRKLGALIIRQFFADTLLIFLPAGVFERRDVEEGTWPRGIKPRHICRIQRAPAIPDFLEIGLVWSLYVFGYGAS